MAVAIRCDWCGETVEGAHQSLPAQLRPEGITECGGLVGDNLPAFQYHASQESPSCLEQACEMLRERSSWAHEGDESGLEWRLVPRTPERSGEVAA